MKKLIYIIALSFIAFSSLLWAAGDVYQTDIPVNSQSAGEKDVAIQRAFNQVLIKVSGNNQILNNPKIAQAVQNASSMVEEYSYSQPTPPLPNVPETAYILKVTFDKEAVDQLLQSVTPVSTEVLTEIPFKVTGVAQQDDLAVMMNYLKQLSPVADVEIEQVAGQEVTLTLSLKGSQDALVKAISADTKLVAAGQTDGVLTYRWSP